MVVENQFIFHFLFFYVYTSDIGEGTVECRILDARVTALNHYKRLAFFGFFHAKEDGRV